AIGVIRPGLLDRDLLVPAVHPADRVGLHGEGHVLVHADFAPPDAAAVGIVALEWRRTVHLLHRVTAATAAFDLDERRCAARAAFVFVQTPASEVMRHGDDTGAQTFGDPGAR